MYLYKGVLITPRKTSTGLTFSDDVIDNLVSQQPRVPVRVNFSGKPIGLATAYEKREDGCVVCSFELNYPDMEKLNLFVVPQGSCGVNDLIMNANTGEVLIKNFELTEVSLTTTPADTTLTTISEENL